MVSAIGVDDAGSNSSPGRPPESALALTTIWRELSIIDEKVASLPNSNLRLQSAEQHSRDAPDAVAVESGNHASHFYSRRLVFSPSLSDMASMMTIAGML